MSSQIRVSSFELHSAQCLLLWWSIDQKHLSLCFLRWEGLLSVIAYGSYILFMKYNSRIMKWLDEKFPSANARYCLGALLIFAWIQFVKLEKLLPSLGQANSMFTPYMRTNLHKLSISEAQISPLRISWGTDSSTIPTFVLQSHLSVCCSTLVSIPLHHKARRGWCFTTYSSRTW